jgi:hypothetical protein
MLAAYDFQLYLKALRIRKMLGDNFLVEGEKLKLPPNRKAVTTETVRWDRKEK